MAVIQQTPKRVVTCMCSIVPIINLGRFFNAVYIACTSISNLYRLLKYLKLYTTPCLLLTGTNHFTVVVITQDITTRYCHVVHFRRNKFDVCVVVLNLKS